MTNDTSAKQAPLVDHLLDSQSQEALNDQCKRVISLLGSSFTNKVDAVRELEAIRWNGGWTKDEFWNRLRTSGDYSDEQIKRIPRDWVTYVDLVRQFRIEGEPITRSTYNRLQLLGLLLMQSTSAILACMVLFCHCPQAQVNANLLWPCCNVLS